MKKLHSIMRFKTIPAQRIANISRIIDAFNKQFPTESIAE